MRVGSLFAGIGGFDLGLERAGMEIRWQVENNLWCQRVLAKHWPNVTRYGDIKQVDWHTIEPVDLVCGGFPCQPFSLAGKRKGFDDDRYLWPEVVRCLDAVRPTWFLGENVPGIVNVALDQVCADLESLGYAVQAFNIPACAVDAAHQRKRIWIVAHANRQGPQRHGAECELGKGGEEVKIGRRGDVADPLSEQSERRLYGAEWGQRSEGQAPCDGGPGRGVENVGWPVEPSVGRVAHGVPARVDRLRGLGNAVVPQVVEVLGRMMIEVKHASLV